MSIIIQQFHPNKMTSTLLICVKGNLKYRIFKIFVHIEVLDGEIYKNLYIKISI